MLRYLAALPTSFIVKLADLILVTFLKYAILLLSLHETTGCYVAVSKRLLIMMLVSGVHTDVYHRMVILLLLKTILILSASFYSFLHLICFQVLDKFKS